MFILCIFLFIFKGDFMKNCIIAFQIGKHMYHTLAVLFVLGLIAIY